MSSYEKLINDILEKSKNLRFDELEKVLVKMGYTAKQPRGGSSHYTFRKPGHQPITIPKKYPLNKAYIEMVAEVVIKHLEEDD